MRLRSKRTLIAIGVLVTLVAAGGALAATMLRSVKADEFDPGKTHLVNGAWLEGIGCPTDATIAIPNAEFNGIGSFGTYTDPACATGDPKDKTVEGLLLAKTGPSVTNFAAAGAKLQGVKGLVLSEIGYDIRKPGTDNDDARGSHCGAGAPRFEILTEEGEFYFLGCNSPEPTTTVAGDAIGFMRLTWGNGTPGSVMAFNASAGFVFEAITDPIASISIVFDEGDDTGPDNFGIAVLDNINVNGVRVGRGNTDPN